jgi:multidrug efflux system outer membrane protein
MSERTVKLVRAAGAASLAGVLALGACKVGPDYTKPEEGTSWEWTADGGYASGRALASVPGAGSPEVERWWTVFNDPVLDALVDRAMAGNLTLAQAESRVRQARAARTVAASGLYPEVDASASGERGRALTNVGGHTSNLFRAGFDATWEIDVFGGVQREVEAAEADLRAAGFDREDLRVILAAEVATAYFDLRGAQHQLAIARENLEAQEQTLKITQERLEAGFVSALDEANAQANARQTESQIPSFDAQIRANIYALGVLVGNEPSALLTELSEHKPLASAPAEVPVGVPSELLKRRPDIRRAEEQLHAATARVGVAVADQYPRFSLTGSFGVQSGKFESLGNAANRFWSFGPAVSVPLFTGGRVEGNIEEAKEVAQQATLAYRQSVLVALQDVETSLASFTREQQRRSALVDAVDANRRAVDLSLQLYNGGRTDFLNVLTAQRQLYATEAQLSGSETAVVTDLVALFKALGGGWVVVEDAAAETSPRGAGPPASSN